MLSKPKVSVVLPNYNHARYLKQRIDSILNQSFKNIEVIILDDCSDDNSRELINQYEVKDSRVVTVFNKINSGSVFKQWQLGIELSKGDYIWIAESDDYAENCFLTSLVEKLDSNANLSFAYCNSNIVDENGIGTTTTANWKNKHFKTDHWARDFNVSGVDELKKYLSVACTVNNASSVLFRRAAIDKVGGINTEYRYTGDWFMYIKLAMVGDIAYTAKCLSNYREHAQNASKTSVADGSQMYERIKCLMYVYEKRLLDKLHQNTILKEAIVEYFVLQYHMMFVRKNPSKLLFYIKEFINRGPIFFMKMQIGSTKFWLNNKLKKRKP